jgi:hypothetical protein
MELTTLDNWIITGCYLFMAIALVVATIWIFKLKTEIRRLKQSLKLTTAKRENSYKFGDKENTGNSDG